eukprot:CAMPEP_0115223054 /NCGR_PEP_ID=MMETSP0270-20121206/28837_1 /TAXON_ID=71861 /ORGANISM="Scrippsiella trochoidea, Strain CCMP3099" /LENGTH=75 /DNA_ID=CAMNT_0002637273 /DNA_START=376 /DNA_END=599 /DNA_ORIENTATION=+
MFCVLRHAPKMQSRRGHLSEAPSSRAHENSDQRSLMGAEAGNLSFHDDESSSLALMPQPITCTDFFCMLRMELFS